MVTLFLNRFVVTSIQLKFRFQKLFDRDRETGLYKKRYKFEFCEQYLLKTVCSDTYLCIYTLLCSLVAHIHIYILTDTYYRQNIVFLSFSGIKLFLLPNFAILIGQIGRILRMHVFTVLVILRQ